MKTVRFAMLASLCVLGGFVASPVQAQMEPGQGDSTRVVPWGGTMGMPNQVRVNMRDANWSPDVDAYTQTDTWETTLNLNAEGLDASERAAEDLTLEGEGAGAFEVRQNNCVGQIAAGQSCGVRVGLKSGVAEGTYTTYVRDAVTGKRVRVTVTYERPKDINLFITNLVIDYSLAQNAVAAGWQNGMGVNLTITGSGAMGSSSTARASLYVGDFPGTVRQLTITNQGRIHGKGGLGGMGSGSEDMRVGGAQGGNGEPGGPAVQFAIGNVTLNNYGVIGGGGGGGGGGQCRHIYHSAGGGGGGAGLTEGSGAPPRNWGGGRELTGQAGQNGTLDQGGAPGCSAEITGMGCPSGYTTEVARSCTTYYSEGGTTEECSVGPTGNCIREVQPAVNCRVEQGPCREVGGSEGTGSQQICEETVVCDQYASYDRTPGIPLQQSRCGSPGGHLGQPGGNTDYTGAWCGMYRGGAPGAAILGAGNANIQQLGGLIVGPIQ